MALGQTVEKFEIAGITRIKEELLLEMGSTMARSKRRVGRRWLWRRPQAAAWGPYVIKALVPSDDSEWPGGVRDMALGWTVDDIQK
jgi:hypothetical protein